MSPDAAIQIWLETMARTRPDIIIPYVQSTLGATLRYRVHAVRTGGQGHSDMTQAGIVNLVPNTATPLLRMSLTRHAADSCSIEVTVESDTVRRQTRTFTCPDPLQP